VSKKNLAVVVIKRNNKFYKFNTITVSNDGSLHIIAGMDSYLRLNGEEKNIPFKGTYHPSGFRHFTQGFGENRTETFPKWTRPHGEVIDSEGLMNFTIRKINEKNVKYLDEFIKFNKYKNIIEINAKDYIDLTIKYFFANKNFNPKGSSFLYNEVFEVELNNGKLLIATRNSSSTQELVHLYLNNI